MRDSPAHYVGPQLFFLQLFTLVWTTGMHLSQQWPQEYTYMYRLQTCGNQASDEPQADVTDSAVEDDADDD